MPKRSKFIFSHPDFPCYAGPSVKEFHLVGTNALMDLQNKLNTIGMESHQSPKINLIVLILYVQMPRRLSAAALFASVIDEKFCSSRRTAKSKAKA